MKKTFLILTMVGAMIAVAPSALATVLAPGTTITSYSTFGAPTGTLVADSGSQTATSLDWTATFRSMVYANAGGTLDFYYQFKQTGAGSSGVNDAIERLTVGFWGCCTTDVGISSTSLTGFGSGTNLPDSIGRSANGNVISFNFVSTALNTGNVAYTLVVKTNGASAISGISSLQNSSTANFSAYEPSAAVPEPASIVLFGSVLGLTAVLARRKLARKG
jgi:hypothetical protein